MKKFTFIGFTAAFLSGISAFALDASSDINVRYQCYIRGTGKPSEYNNWTGVTTPGTPWKIMTVEKKVPGDISFDFNPFAKDTIDVSIGFLGRQGEYKFKNHDQAMKVMRALQSNKYDLFQTYNGPPFNSSIVETCPEGRCPENDVVQSYEDDQRNILKDESIFRKGIYTEFSREETSDSKNRSNQYYQTSSGFYDCDSMNMHAEGFPRGEPKDFYIQLKGANAARVRFDDFINDPSILERRKNEVYDGNYDFTLGGLLREFGDKVFGLNNASSLDDPKVTTQQRKPSAVNDMSDKDLRILKQDYWSISNKAD